MDLAALRLEVENEVKHYRYPSTTKTLGNPWTEERIRAELAAMKEALVSPYWTDVLLRDTIEQMAATSASSRKCIVVADDRKGTLLAFDPDENEFMLVVNHNNELSTIGVRGDSVGCFMAR